MISLLRDVGWRVVTNAPLPSQHRRAKGSIVLHRAGVDVNECSAWTVGKEEKDGPAGGGVIKMSRPL